MMTMETTLGIGHAARLLGITVKTLQRWEREGRLVPAARTTSNRRRYTESQLRGFLHLPSPGAPRRIVAYCRVSSAVQRPDLANQRRTLEQFTAARGLAGVEFIEEVGGGLNFARKRFVALMDAIGRDEVAT
ncbi:MerR family DNA-binding transcriptional regulator, partial [Massilia agri]